VSSGVAVGAGTVPSSIAPRSVARMSSELCDAGVGAGQCTFARWVPPPNPYSVANICQYVEPKMKSPNASSVARLASSSYVMVTSCMLLIT